MARRSAPRSAADKTCVFTPYRTITIGARVQYVVKVSPEDYDFLMQWRWTYAVSHQGGGLVYARRSVRSIAAGPSSSG